MLFQNPILLLSERAALSGGHEAPPKVESRSDRSLQRLVRRQMPFGLYIINLHRQTPGQAR